MKQVTTISLDIVKSVFQVTGVSGSGEVIVRRRLRRARVAEFFAGLGALSDRHRSLAWARQLKARSLTRWWRCPWPTSWPGSPGRSWSPMTRSARRRHAENGGRRAVKIGEVLMV